MQTPGNTNPIGAAATQACVPDFKHKDLAMPNRLGLLALPLLAGLLLAAGSVHAQATALTLAANSELDNTGQNARDRGGATLTPEDQKENSADVKITAAIRKAVVKQKSLSLDAHNAKIITRGGVVTLRGPVKDAAEKAKLQSIAEKTRGVKQVDNQLEPKTP